jgi:hypothetical protein
MKEFWDFDENKNYTTVNIRGIDFKVINKYHDYKTAGIILYNIHIIIHNICKYLQVNFYRYSKTDQKYIKCFLDIHPNKYLLSEMQLGTMFNGINKPRNLFHSRDNISIGKDGTLRAGYRHIFLTLRKSNGNFKDFNKIMELVIHEFAHTMCNHVTWRDDDHGSDFKNAEKILWNSYKKL